MSQGRSVGVKMVVKLDEFVEVMLNSGACVRLSRFVRSPFRFSGMNSSRCMLARWGPLNSFIISTCL